MNPKKIPSSKSSLATYIEQKVTVPLKYSEIARNVGINNAQTVKYYLSKLEDEGLISIDFSNKLIKFCTNRSNFVSLPIRGEANCGSATIYAEDDILGYLKVSKSILGFSSLCNDFYLLRAVGDSMNKCQIKGKSIESGDYVVVDGNNIVPHDGGIYVSLIDGCANIKKYKVDHANSRYLLISESSKGHYESIVLSEGDNLLIKGAVIDVIKGID